MSSNRRKFLKNLGFAGAGLVVGNKLLAKDYANKSTYFINSSSRSLLQTNVLTELDQINIALIGAGGMGMSDATTALTHSNINILAVCDLYNGRLEQAKARWGETLFVTKDYKEILKRQDIDAIIIGTPDHWHRQISVDALNAGKHVYCEKPMVHSVDEGKEVIATWQKSNKIFMMGSQGLSSLGNEEAKRLFESGAIGELNYAEGFWARMSAEGAWQYNIPADASPQTIDWDKFIENVSNKMPFDATRFFRWRNYLDYGTGMAGDLFVHLFSSLHFIISSLGPNKISAMGGLRYWKDGREVPDVLLGMFDYPKADKHPAFNLSLRCNFVDGTSGNTYLKLVGTKGSLNIGWDDIVLTRNTNIALDDSDPFFKEKKNNPNFFEEERKRILPQKETTFKVETGYKGAHYDHFSNFFRAIRNKTTVVEDPIFGFRATAPALLCNASYKENKFMYWDPVNMQVLNK